MSRTRRAMYIGLSRASIGRRYSLPEIRRDFGRNWPLYLLALPVLAYFLVFHYWPMYGVVIAFKEFSPRLGILRSPWIGFQAFRDFFSSFYFWRLLRNTFVLSFWGIVFGFPAPILFALLLNEVRDGAFKKGIQTLSYLPYFVSMVVICGIVIDFTAQAGLINDLLVTLGADRANLLMKPELFRTIFITSGIWQGLGWGTIIYLAALSAINPELYDAATIDGAGRFGRAVHVTLPGIAPTITILLILTVGQLMSVSFEKVILLYNPVIYETADVISSFVYRKGLLEFNYSFSAAVGLFNSLINFALLVSANSLSRRFSETSLW